MRIKLAVLCQLLISVNVVAQTKTLESIKDIRKEYARILVIAEYDSVKKYVYIPDEPVPTDDEAIFFFYLNNELVKCIHLEEGSGEGGTYSSLRKEIFFKNQKPFFVFERYMWQVFGMGDISEDCIKNDKCSGYIERRNYYDKNGILLRCLEKMIKNFENLEEIIKRTPNIDQQCSSTKLFFNIYEDKLDEAKILKGERRNDVEFHGLFDMNLSSNGNDLISSTFR